MQIFSSVARNKRVGGATVSGGFLANRPAGLTPKFEHNFENGTYGNATWGSVNGADVGTMYLSSRITDGWTANTDPSAPRSPDYISHNFPVGYVYGAGPAIMDFWGGETTGDGNSYDELYFSYAMRMRTGNGTSWELKAAFPGIKAGGYLGVAVRGSMGAFQALIFLEGDADDATEFRPRFVTQIDSMGDQQTASMTAAALLADPYPVKVDQWHEYEVRLRLGTAGATVTGSPPSGNGRVEMWLDGNLIIDDATIAFINSTDSDGFWGRRRDEVLGGNNPSLIKAREDHVDISYEVVDAGAQVA